MWCIHSTAVLNTKKYLPNARFTWASYQIRKIACCTCAGNVGNVFPATDVKGNSYLAIPACITARASRTCRDSCRDRLSRSGEENIPGIPGACATRNFTYLARGPCSSYCGSTTDTRLDKFIHIGKCWRDYYRLKVQIGFTWQERNWNHACTYDYWSKQPPLGNVFY